MFLILVVVGDVLLVGAISQVTIVVVIT